MGKRRLRKLIIEIRREISETSTEHGPFLKIITFSKFVRGIFYTALGIGLIMLVGNNVGVLLRDLLDWIKIGENNPHVIWILRRAELIEGRMIILASILALFYGITGFLQAIGLHYRRRWAEYITALAATFLIPGEIYLLIKGPTLYKVFLLASNLLVVGYLIHVKGLFLSLLGGSAAVRRSARHHPDKV